MSLGKMSNSTQALIGAGHMGGALLDGWLANKNTVNEEHALSPSQILVIDPNPGDAAKRALEVGVNFANTLTSGSASGLKACLLAIKPQLFSKIGADIANALPSDCVVISIMAGIDLAGLEAVFGARPIVRTMPNMPAAYGAGITAYVGNRHANEQHLALAEARLQVGGKTIALSGEAQIDMVTALSGSGPAYVFYLCEAMTEAGVKLGLPQDMAAQLARQTIIGSGIVLENSEKKAADLRASVTSKGGTTAAALDVLMGRDDANHNLDTVMTQAMGKAFARAKELGQSS